MKQLKMAVIGCGNRGFGLLKDILLNMQDVDVIGVCDQYPDRVERAALEVERRSAKRPFGTTDHMDILRMEALDAVLVSSSWETHVEIAIDALKAGGAMPIILNGANEAAVAAFLKGQRRGQQRIRTHMNSVLLFKQFLNPVYFFFHNAYKVMRFKVIEQNRITGRNTAYYCRREERLPCQRINLCLKSI